MGRTFKIEIDEEDGRVVNVEPPGGGTAKRGDLKEKPMTFSNVSKIIVPIQLIKSNPTCTVHSWDCRTWEWPC